MVGLFRAACRLWKFVMPKIEICAMLASELSPDIAEQFREEGRKEGRKEGRAEGRAEGRNLTLKEGLYACTFLVVATAYLLSG